MDPREQRGLVIAALCKLSRTKEGWLVPSQTGAERIYRVDVKNQKCTCPDHEEAGFKCKHLHAVEFTIKRELGADGTLTETRSMTLTERKVYPQNWAAYNESQSTEKHRFQILLADLCNGVEQPNREGIRGRLPKPIRDVVFSSVFKVYVGFSARRFNCDLQDAHKKGYLSEPVHCHAVNHYMERKELTPILHGLIARSATPLQAIEHDFAVDSTGFSASKFVRWYDQKYGITRKSHAWIKVHAACGVSTNIITAVRVFNHESADSPQFAPLIATTAENFQIKEVSADKAYLSRGNLDLVMSLGGSAYIPFKANCVSGEPGSLWERMFHYYQFRREEFNAMYHKRSNIESSFSAIKRKFGDYIRSRTDTAMVNEVLAKVLCNNLTCVIQSQCELGIEPIFWQDKTEAVSDILCFPSLRRNSSS